MKQNKPAAAQVAMARKAAEMAAENNRRQAAAAVIPKHTARFPSRPRRRAASERTQASDGDEGDGDGDDGAIRLLSKPQILDRTGLSFPTIWSMMRSGIFPRARVLGGKSVWLEDEVNAFIHSLPVRPYKGDASKSAA